MKNRTIHLIVLLLACVAFSPVAKASPGTTSNVNVVNTPNVNVANTPTVNVGNQPTVTVATSTPTPLLVRDVDNPARQPFQDQETATFDALNPFTNVDSVPVPAGKQLVIEHVSVITTLPVGQKLLIASVQPFVGGMGTGHFLTVIAQGTNAAGTADYSVASQDIRLYADPGLPISFHAERNGTAGTGSVTFEISGYLINMP